MRKLAMILLILVLGALIFSPIIGMMDLDPVPGDFAFDFNHQHFNVPVAYSLCASAFLALLYSVLKR